MLIIINYSRVSMEFNYLKQSLIFYLKCAFFLRNCISHPEEHCRLQMKDRKQIFYLMVYIESITMYGPIRSLSVYHSNPAKDFLVRQFLYLF